MLTLVVLFFVWLWVWFACPFPADKPWVGWLVLAGLIIVTFIAL